MNGPLNLPAKLSLRGRRRFFCLLALSLSHPLSSAFAQVAVPPPTAPGAAAIAAGTSTQPATAPAPAPARGRGQRQMGPPTLGLEDGYLEFDTPEFKLKLVKDSQTIAAMEPKGAKGMNDTTPFDFTPADQLAARASDRFNHLGDIDFRVRVGNDRLWGYYASSAARKPVNTQLSAPEPDGLHTLALSDLTPTFPDACPLQVIRYWATDASNRLVLHFTLRNKSDQPVTIGGLGFPVIFNNMITNFARLDRMGNPMARTLPQAHEICSFFDPYVGQDGGYLQVTRLSGAGPALLVVPETGTKTPFEAYRPLTEPYGDSQTFEGAFEWTTRSQAYAENEWKGVNEWNPATSETLQPGQTVSHGLRFLVSDTIRNIEKTLTANNRPVAVGIPGYVLPTDIDAKLFINPAGRKVTAVDTDPKDSILVNPATPAPNGTLQYTLHGKTWGRARLTLTYDDGSTQAIHYYVIKPEAEAVSDLGNFLFTKQWFTDESDPFHRAPSVISYDRSKNEQVTRDTRVWIAGLEDEGGAGSWLAAAMKEFGQPKKEEVDKFAQFVDKVLWGGIQFSEGPRMYGVRKSMFYYDPKDLPDYNYGSGNWTSWTSWSKTASEDTGRAYNYPHVVAAYWSMYRLARNNPGLVTNQKWEWYLDHAFNTVKFLTGGFQTGRGRGGVGYLNTGLMEGDVFVYLLQDLKREGWKEQADYIETAMKARADRWNREAYPFGSEMAWDSTGQEEVYAWTAFFGYNDKALVSLDSILGYMPTVPHWGYNGNARRYWDFIYGGAPNQGIERQLHHYGSGINAIPALAQYRQHPDDLYLLRIGYGGTMGALTNIDQDGFAAVAFHSYPNRLRWDAYSGDYGPNFFGHAVNTATYVVDDPNFGWQAFGGNLTTSAANGQAAGAPATIAVQCLDSFRKRIYIAPLGLYLTLDAGKFDSVRYAPATHSLQLTFASADTFTPNALLRIEQPAKIEGIGAFTPSTDLKTERDAFVIPLTDKTTDISLTMK